MSTPVYRFGPFRFDPAAHDLTRDGESIALPTKALGVLAVLVKNHDRVVEKEEILREVWHDVFVSDDSLTQNIFVIRRALGDNSVEPRFVATVARRGYRFIAPVIEEPAQARLSQGAAAESASLPSVATPGTNVAPALASLQWRAQRAVVWVVAGAAVAIVAAVAIATTVVVRSRSAEDVRAVRLFQTAPAGTTLTSRGVLSPGGESLVFGARDNASGKSELWVRDLESAEARMISGTDGASRPFWSPDGRAIGFFANGTVRTVSLTGEGLRTLAPVGIVDAGGTWSASGTILFADLWGLSSVSATGGTVTAVTTIDKASHDGVHRSPQFLPDGRHFLYYVISADRARAGTFVGSLDSPDRVRVMDSSVTGVLYCPTGHLIYVRDRSLFAQRFDPTTFKVSGEPRLLVGSTAGAPPIADLSAAGSMLAFGGAARNEQLTWFDRSGRKLGEVETLAAIHGPALSADQKHLVGTTAGDPEHAGVWLLDLERNASTRVSVRGGGPISSPDGMNVLFTSNRTTGVMDLYGRATGRDEDEALLVSDENKILNDWSQDGRFISFVSASPKTKQDLWILPIMGDRKPVPFLQTPFNEIQSKIAPDVRHIAYASDESGTWEVYVQSFPAAGDKRVISVGGGAEPQWRGDGRELFYLAADDTIMSVEVRTNGTWEIGRPTPLFRLPIQSSATSNRTWSRDHYAVTADGQRFVVDAVDPARAEPINIVVNWTAWLKH